MTDTNTTDDPAVEPDVDDELQAGGGRYHPDNDDELLEPEVVPEGQHRLPAVPQPDPAAEALAATDAAITAAAEAALAMPDIPGRDEFLSLCMQAKVMAEASIVPKALRGKPHDVLVVLLTGRDLGIPVTTALRKVYVIDGQPSLAPQLLNARIRQLGLGAIRPHPDTTDTRAGAIPLGPDGIELGPTVWFSWDDAKRAKLVGRNCEPWEHASGCKCKDNWKAYPQRMLWWRAAGYAADDYFPEASLGLYSPDELGAITMDDGTPIDVDSVELPPGFEGRGRGGPDGTEPADLETLQGLHVSLLALPPEVLAEAKDRWREQLPPIGKLTDAEARRARALLSGFQSQARKVEGWQAPAAEAEVRAAVEAGTVRLVGMDAPEAPAEQPDAPDAPPEAAEADSDAQEPPAGLPEPGAVQWPELDEVEAMTKPLVVRWLLHFNLDHQGRADDVRARLYGHVADLVADAMAAEDTEQHAQADAAEAAGYLPGE